MKIGIFGGSFNPPHNAHLEICRYVQAQMHFDKIILIPTGRQPAEKTDDDTGRAHRLNMARLMCEGMGWMEVSDIEISRTGKSYTVDTLRALKRTGSDDYSFIVGADILHHLPNWRDFGLLCRMVRFISVMRGGVDMGEALNAAQSLSEKFGAAVTVFDYEPRTSLRARARTGGRRAGIFKTDSRKHIRLYRKKWPLQVINDMYEKEAEKLKSMLSEKRYTHSLNTAETAAALAGATAQTRTGLTWRACCTTRQKI
jgi:nicotinate-nucleotide adenylyltransferase